MMQRVFTLFAIIGVFFIDGCVPVSNRSENLMSPAPSARSIAPTLAVPIATPDIESTLSPAVPTFLAPETEGNGPSYKPALSSNGRYIAFESIADNLVSGDTNGVTDIFVRDHQTNQIERVSVASAGSQADDDSHTPAISSDGRFVVFLSWAGNLVPDDTYRCGSDHKSCLDIFVYDRKTGLIDLVSRATNGEQARGPSESPDVSANGRYVVFVSHASNLVSGDTNGVTDIFIHDRQTSQTELISEASDGSQTDGPSASPTISGDGRFVVFWSAATNLSPESMQGVFIHDRLSGTTQWISEGIDPGISDNGNRIAFLTIGPQAAPRLVIYDRESGTQKSSVELSIEFHGRELGITHISADGRWVTFSSKMEGLFQVFLYDYERNESKLVSTTLDGTPGNDTSWEAAISDDGNIVVFSSNASNLVVNDTNQVTDIFLYDRLIRGIERISVPSGVRP